MASEASPIVTLLSSFLKIKPTESFVYLFHVINLLDSQGARLLGHVALFKQPSPLKEGAQLLVCII